jgi:PAS domain S-box-containing protein
MRRLFAHRQLDDKLRKSEARYRTVLDAAFDAIVTITPDGIVRWFNRGAERIFGYRAEEVIGQPVTVIMPERYRELCVAGLHRYLRTGEARVVGGTTELVGLRKDGSEFPIEMSLGEVLEDGEQLFTGVIRDVTERKRIEDSLREMRDRFRSIFDHAPIGVAMVSLEGRYLQVNRSLCEILGYTEEELQALTWQEITHPDDLAASSAHARRIVEGEFPKYHLEKRFLHADGRTVWASLSVSLVRDAEGEPLYFVSQIQDVSERKNIEKRIKESEERFRSLVQNSSDIITILEADGTVRYVSPAVERVTGYRPEEQVGTNAFGSVHPDDRDRALDTFAEVLKRPGLHPPLEFRVPHKDGSWRYLEHVVNNLVDAKPW